VGDATKGRPNVVVPASSLREGLTSSAANRAAPVGWRAPRFAGIDNLLRSCEYPPKDFEVSRIMGDIVDVVAEHHGVAAVP
jgi:hypothetical protein